MRSYQLQTCSMEFPVKQKRRLDHRVKPFFLVMLQKIAKAPTLAQLDKYKTYLVNLVDYECSPGDVILDNQEWILVIRSLSAVLDHRNQPEMVMSTLKTVHSLCYIEEFGKLFFEESQSFYNLLYHLISKDVHAVSLNEFNMITEALDTITIANENGLFIKPAMQPVLNRLLEWYLPRLGDNQFDEEFLCKIVRLLEKSSKPIDHRKKKEYAGMLHTFVEKHRHDSVYQQAFVDLANLIIKPIVTWCEVEEALWHSAMSNWFEE
jgi:hypothetical protein